MLMGKNKKSYKMKTHGSRYYVLINGIKFEVKYLPKKLPEIKKGWFRDPKNSRRWLRVAARSEHNSNLKSVNPIKAAMQFGKNHDAVESFLRACLSKRGKNTQLEFKTCYYSKKHRRLISTKTKRILQWLPLIHDVDAPLEHKGSAILIDNPAEYDKAVKRNTGAVVDIDFDYWMEQTAEKTQARIRELEFVVKNYYTIDNPDLPPLKSVQIELEKWRSIEAMINDERALALRELNDREKNGKIQRVRKVLALIKKDNPSITEYARAGLLIIPRIKKEYAVEVAKKFKELTIDKDLKYGEGWERFARNILAEKDKYLGNLDCYYYNDIPLYVRMHKAFIALGFEVFNGSDGSEYSMFVREERIRLGLSKLKNGTAFEGFVKINENIWTNGSAYFTSCDMAHIFGRRLVELAYQGMCLYFEKKIKYHSQPRKPAQRKPLHEIAKTGDRVLLRTNVWLSYVSYKNGEYTGRRFGLLFKFKGSDVQRFLPKNVIRKDLGGSINE